MHTYIHLNVNKRWKMKENKETAVYMNNKRLEQFKTIRYLGIIIVSKISFREHIMYISQKCAKLIHALSKSAKLK